MVLKILVALAAQVPQLAEVEVQDNLCVGLWTWVTACPAGWQHDDEEPYCRPEGGPEP